MSGRKPVCKRFLSGECKATNCKFYHPKNAHAQQQHHSQQRHAQQQHHHAQQQHHAQHQQQHAQQPVPEQRKTVSEMLHERLTAYAKPAPRRSNYIQPQEPVTQPAAVVSNTITQPVAKPGTFGAKLQSSVTQKFDKVKFEEWLYNDMPNIDAISIIELYRNLLKFDEEKLLEYANKSNEIIPDIMAMIGHGLTNKKWLKELYGRFLGDSYVGIKSFNMKTIKDLLVFTIMQIYLKTQTCDFKNIEHMICLYVCIMKIIGKNGILLDIDPIDVIEKNYKNHMYDMVCIV